MKVRGRVPRARAGDSVSRDAPEVRADGRADKGERASGLMPDAVAAKPGQQRRLSVPETLDGNRADKALAEMLGVARTRLAPWFAAGLVTAAGRPLKPADRLATGTILDVPATDPEGMTGHPLVAEERPLSVLYEDRFLLVVDKPAGLVVHPAAGHWQGTLVHALLGRDTPLAHGPASYGRDARPGIVHRLDKDTSGLLVVAKTDEARAGLESLFREHRIERTYRAIVRGEPPAQRGRIEAPLGRDARNRLRRTVLAGGRQAVTHFEVLERHARGAVLTLRLETGRTHQIRVHLLHLGIPVVGDPLYGTPEDRRRQVGQLLHSWRLRMRHPVTGRELCLEAPLPERMVLAEERLRRGEDPLGAP